MTRSDRLRLGKECSGQRKMSKHLSRVWKFLAFVVIPMLGAVSPLIALPAVTANYGASGWAAVAVGQSVGMGAAVVVELGWSLNGPQRIAKASTKNRRRILAFALASKALVLTPIAIVAWFVTSLLVPEHTVAAGIVAVGSASVGLTSNWFFIGAGSPGRIVLTDSLPRILTVSLGAMAITMGGPLESYGIAIIVPSLLAPVLALRLVGVQRNDTRLLGFRRTVWIVRAQMVAFTARAISAVYIALPIMLVSIASPNSVPVFAAAERLQRMALTILQSIPNFMQGWVGRGKTTSVRLRRAGHAIWINATLGVVAGLVYSLLAPWAAQIVFSQVVEIPVELSALSGLLIFFVCCSRATGNITLVALQKIHIIMYSALGGALVGVPSIFIFAAMWGPEGALVGELLAEATVLVIQLIFTVSKRRKEE